MKKEFEIRLRIRNLVSEYQQSNSFGQSVISQVLSNLCWVVDMDFNKLYKDSLKKYSKARNKLR